jgi:hypothetical protein
MQGIQIYFLQVRFPPYRNFRIRSCMLKTGLVKLQYVGAWGDHMQWICKLHCEAVGCLDLLAFVYGPTFINKCSGVHWKVSDRLCLRPMCRKCADWCGPLTADYLPVVVMTTLSTSGTLVGSGRFTPSRSTSPP